MTDQTIFRQRGSIKPSRFVFRLIHLCRASRSTIEASIIGVGPQVNFPGKWRETTSPPTNDCRTTRLLQKSCVEALVESFDYILKFPRTKQQSWLLTCNPLEGRFISGWRCGQIDERLSQNAGTSEARRRESDDAG